MPPVPPVNPRLLRASWIASALGVLAIVLATLDLASAGYGTRVRRGFGDRRSYDMVKPAVHRALPRVALTGGCGVGLLVAGGALRRRARGDGGDGG